MKYKISKDATIQEIFESHSLNVLAERIQSGEDASTLNEEIDNSIIEFRDDLEYDIDDYKKAGISDQSEIMQSALFVLAGYDALPKNVRQLQVNRSNEQLVAFVKAQAAIAVLLWETRLTFNGRNNAIEPTFTLTQARQELAPIIEKGIQFSKN